MAKNPHLGIIIPAIVVSIMAIGITLPTTNLAWAVTIVCNSVPCLGTSNGDTMIGSSQDDFIFSKQGGDSVYGFGGGDTICGASGDDVLIGGEGNDQIVGDGSDTNQACNDPLSDPAANPGADKIAGGPGDDLIFHGNKFPNSLDSDGHRDIIDCGPGNDEASINVSVDHDIATNCETVNAG